MIDDHEPDGLMALTTYQVIAILVDILLRLGAKVMAQHGLQKGLKTFRKHGAWCRVSPSRIITDSFGKYIYINQI